ncbi:MAG: ferritin-like domain-containing protein, partial [Candidatus Bathyarchaeia archaeon]
KKAEEEGDITTSELFRDILKDEENHHDFFTSILEEV